MGNNLILDRSYQFALNVIALSRLLGERREFVLSRQLLRAGTSVGANVEEALAAQSSKDFRSKLAIARRKLERAATGFGFFATRPSCPNRNHAR